MAQHGDRGTVLLIVPVPLCREMVVRSGLDSQRRSGKAAWPINYYPTFPVRVGRPLPANYNMSPGDGKRHSCRGGGGRKKFLVPAYSFFFPGVPPEGGGVQKKFARIFFQPPPAFLVLRVAACL